MSASSVDLELASLGQRTVAALIDSGLVLSAVGAVIGGAIGVAAMLAKEPATASDRFEGLAKRMPQLGETPWSQLLNATSGLASLSLRNTRSPGMRVMHIRRADARTGGPVTLRSQVIQQLFGLAWGRLAKWVWRPAFERHQAQAKTLAAEHEEFRRRHPDDPKADAAFYTSRRTPGTASCCGLMLAPLAIQQLTAVLSPRRQNISDWVAGIVVVVDD